MTCFNLLKSIISVSIVLIALFLITPFPITAEEPILSSGASVYVPVYSNVYSGPRAKSFELAAMISIRNTDPKNPITIVKADYYDNDGKLIARYLKDAIVLKPLASTHYYIKEYDKRGGPGANFIVKWESETKVNQPIIEGIMLGLASGQGLSFICPGKTIIE